MSEDDAMSETDDLLPCPFCLLGDLSVVEPRHPWDGYHVDCIDPDCLASGPRRPTEELAIRGWNERVRKL